MKKALAFLTASVMALGSLPFLSVGAESFAPGDVDMDGVITGHDTAWFPAIWHVAITVFPGSSWNWQTTMGMA